jgi:hypothetical protein
MSWEQIVMHEIVVITNPDTRRKCAAGMGRAMAMRAPGQAWLRWREEGLAVASPSSD